MAVVLIPAYKPETRMLDLIQELNALKEFEGIVVVNDGSGEEFADVFAQAAQLGATVLRHAVNRGKGQGIKTGLNHIMLEYPGQDVVTADCDGQHAPLDIARVSTELRKGDGAVILGSRKPGKNMPFKSKAGNTMMRYGFYLSTGAKIMDTQTGLRGLPATTLKRMMGIKGERYEYEMNVLLDLAKKGIVMREIPIEVIYIDQNAGSHFHPLRDAFNVFVRLFAFAASSIVSYGIDYLLYFLLINAGGFVPGLAYPIARFFSSMVNFGLNRQYVFKERSEPMVAQLVKYYILVLVVLAMGTAGVYYGSMLGINNYVCKIIVDVVLYAVSFVGQRLLVFVPKTKVIRQDSNGSV